MKYMFTILALIVLGSMVTLYYLLPSDSVVSQDIALRINGHTMSHDQLDDQKRKLGYHGESMEDRVDSLVTRHVLLQEAQRVGIDKEDSFRDALKEYYEQSLIKVLTDRQLASVTVDVSEEDIDQYLSCSGKIFTFTRIPVEKGEPLEKQSRQNKVLFDDLSESLRLVLANLKPGESISQFDTGTEVSLIRLDQKEKVEEPDQLSYDRNRVRELLGNYQRSMEIDRWINSLRKKASIVVYDEAEKND